MHREGNNRKDTNTFFSATKHTHTRATNAIYEKMSAYNRANERWYKLMLTFLREIDLKKIIIMKNK
jgi:hypothetical protein